MHVVIESDKPSVDVRASLEKLIPPIDKEIPLLVGDGITDRLKQRLEAAPELSIFSSATMARFSGYMAKPETPCNMKSEIRLPHR